MNLCALEIIQNAHQPLICSTGSANWDMPVSSKWSQPLNSSFLSAEVLDFVNELVNNNFLEGWGYNRLFHKWSECVSYLSEDSICNISCSIFFCWSLVHCLDLYILIVSSVLNLNLVFIPIFHLCNFGIYDSSFCCGYVPLVPIGSLS